MELLDTLLMENFEVRWSYFVSFLTIAKKFVSFFEWKSWDADCFFVAIDCPRVLGNRVRNCMNFVDLDFARTTLRLKAENSLGDIWHLILVLKNPAWHAGVGAGNCKWASYQMPAIWLISYEYFTLGWMPYSQISNKRNGFGLSPN